MGKSVACLTIEIEGMTKKEIGMVEEREIGKETERTNRRHREQSNCD